MSNKILFSSSFRAFVSAARAASSTCMVVLSFDISCSIATTVSFDAKFDESNEGEYTGAAGLAWVTGRAWTGGTVGLFPPERDNILDVEADFSIEL